MRHTPACLQYHERLSLPFLISCFLSAASMAAKSAPSSCGPFFLALFAARRAACASALPSSRSSPSASLPAKEARVDLCWPKVSRGLETMWTHSSPASTAGLDTPALEIAWLLAICLNPSSGNQDTRQLQLTLAAVPILLLAKGEVAAGPKSLQLLRQALGTLRTQLAQLRAPSCHSHRCNSL